MTLGEKIAKLRTSQNMSQGDLAEKMNVSRQSISKWETDTSVPDLERLIIMSELFGVSIDEMVKDKASVWETNITNETNAEKEESKAETNMTQKIIGFILLGVGILGTLLSIAASAFSVSFLLIVPSAYLLLCGTLCLAVKKNVGLIIGWITFLPCVYFAPYMSGIRMGAILNPQFYRFGHPVSLAILFLLWVFLIILVILTARKTFLKNHVSLTLGWVILFNFKGFIPIIFKLNGAYEVYYKAMSLAVILLLILLIAFTTRAIVKFVKANGREEISKRIKKIFEKKSTRALAVIAVIMAAALLAAAFVSYAKFNTRNPFATAVGLAEVVFTDDYFVEIQSYPKVIVAKPQFSIEEYMAENGGFKEDEEAV